MDELLALHPDGEEPGSLFKGIFLARLPQDMRDHIQSRANELTCQELAKYADHLYDSRNSTKAKVLAALPLPPLPDLDSDNQEDKLTDMVAALSSNKPHPTKGKNFNRSNTKPAHRGSSRDGQPKPGGTHGHGAANTPPPGICYTHFKYGASAFNCRDPQNCLLSLEN